MNPGNETIKIDGKSVVTLKELLRPGLRAVFVGISPAPVSVQAGHYYQGRQGRHFWGLLEKFDVINSLPKGAEDIAAFEQGFGFADLLRRPAAGLKNLDKEEKYAAVEDLVGRLVGIGDRPIIAFTYAIPWHLANGRLMREGFQVVLMRSMFRPTGPGMRDLVSALERCGGVRRTQ